MGMALEKNGKNPSFPSKSTLKKIPAAFFLNGSLFRVKKNLYK
jgi:hypothetical protein